MNKKAGIALGIILLLGMTTAAVMGVNKPSESVVSKVEAPAPAPVSAPAPELPVSSQKDVVWGQQMGTAAEDLTVAIAVTPEGNSCAVGYTLGDLTDANKGDKDIFAVSLDSDGNKIWELQSGTDSNDVANSVVLNSAGEAYITGNTLGQFGQESGSGRIFVQKVSKEGKLLWTKQYGPDKRASSNAIRMDQDENIYIAGTTEGEMGEMAYGVSDAFIMKLDSEGNSLWTCQWGSSGSDEVKGIDIDNSGNIYAIGNTYGTLGEANLGLMDIFLSQISSEGKVIYNRQFGSASNETATQVLVDGDNNLYLTGWSDGDFADKQKGSGDSIVFKVSKDGKELWKKQFGTSLWDGVHAIVLSKEDPKSVIVGGCQNYSNCQAFLRKFDTDGNEIWKKELIPTFSTCGREIAIDDQGYIYQTGGTHGQLFGTAGFKGFESDIFVYKISEK